VTAASRAASFFAGFGAGALALYVVLVWSGALRSPVPAPSASPPTYAASPTSSVPPIMPPPAAASPPSPPVAEGLPPPTSTTFLPEPAPFTFPPEPVPQTPPPLDVPSANEPPRSVPGPRPDLTDFERLRARALAVPVQGKTARDLQDNFAELRGGASHEAIDILAPRGTPVVAVAAGTVKKLLRASAAASPSTSSIPRRPTATTTRTSTATRTAWSRASA